MKIKNFLIILTATFVFGAINIHGQPTPSLTPPEKQTPPQVEEWNDDFSGDKLDEKKGRDLLLKAEAAANSKSKTVRCGFTVPPKPAPKSAPKMNLRAKD